MRKIYLSSEVEVSIVVSFLDRKVLSIEIGGEKSEYTCFNVKEKYERVKQFLSENDSFYVRVGYDWDIMQSLNSDDCVNLL